ncbi:hypothetical protein UA08_08843 [Talaromyces atroroseus]|uniref:Zn(2)-C6 fungal-type domain-containing protein n=1 Tax=Talaromyces atroroseus TaxID=1441469 RepID=A0A225A6A2_TALAT|nr:hypothetical protein UA08_08843 [Talaromyces atroroseus]OKL55882.1 hypothetical protein UA08_08843 [Talaromyces atroroseus]
MADLGRGEGQKSRSKKSVSRQSRSCRICRLRKVRCDRVRPCHACCAYGHPSKCVYDIGSDDEEAQPITQAEEIRNLRNEIKELRNKINQHGGQEARTRKLAELERLFQAIRSAPIDVVDDLVGGIRADHHHVRSRAIEDELPLRMLTPSSLDGIEDKTGYSWNLVRSRQSNAGLSDSHSSSGSSSTESISVEEDWCGPLSRFTPQKPMLDLFIQRFVDAFSPEVDASSGHAGALRAGAEIRIFSPLISSAYDAVSLTYFGRSVKDPRIEAAGMQIYPKVLRSLQEALLDPERSRSESTLVTVTLLLAFESIERTSDAGVIAHVRGAAQLIKHRGPENHVHGVEHLLFTELRPYWAGVALADRKPSFMADNVWKTVPWSAGTTKKDLLDYLVDLVVEVPALLGEHDDLITAQESQILGRGELRAKQARLWNRISDLTSRFFQWKKEHVDCYPGGPVKEARIPQGPDPFPVFRCRDLRSMKIIEPPPLVYPDLRLIQTMSFYYASRLILSSIDDRPEGAISMAEKYQLACGIARSLEDYLRRAPGNMINRLAFSTRVAWEAFPSGGVERGFMAQVFNLVEKRHSLRLWGSFMPELSAYAGSNT